MNSSRRIVRIVGVLYLVQMAAAVTSYSVILDPILHTENFLVALSDNSVMVTMAMFFDIICGASVLAIAVLLFPILRRFSERVAVWYVGQRLTELVAFMVSGMLLLTLLSIGQQLANGTAADATGLTDLGRYLRDARGNLQNISLVVYCLGAWSLYGLLYRSRLIPRFISAWGVLAVALLFIEIVSDIFGRSAGGMMIMMPLGVNEVFLGIWLIAKGFNLPPENSLVAKPA